MSRLLNPEPAKPSLRAKDLLGQALLIRPGEYREEQSARDEKPWKFAACTVLVLNGDGIKSREEDVRISWTYVVPQLRRHPGEWIHGRPVKHDQTVVLEPLDDKELAVAERVLEGLDSEGND